MAQQYDLLTKISPYLDKHLLFPLLEHVQSQNVTLLAPRLWQPPQFPGSMPSPSLAYPSQSSRSTPRPMSSAHSSISSPRPSSWTLPSTSTSSSTRRRMSLMVCPLPFPPHHFAYPSRCCPPPTVPFNVTWLLPGVLRSVERKGEDSHTRSTGAECGTDSSTYRASSSEDH